MAGKSRVSSDKNRVFPSSSRTSCPQTPGRPGSDEDLNCDSKNVSSTAITKLRKILFTFFEEHPKSNLETSAAREIKELGQSRLIGASDPSFAAESSTFVYLAKNVVGRVSTHKNKLSRTASFHSRFGRQPSKSTSDSPSAKKGLVNDDEDESATEKRQPCWFLIRKSKTMSSDYHVHLEAGINVRIAHLLDSTRDYYVHLKNTLAAQANAVKDDNKRLLKKMAKRVILYDCFAHFENALHLLHRVHFYTGECIKLISYYYENDLSQKQLEQVAGKSIIGSYMWIIVMCMQAVHSHTDKDQEAFEEIKRTLEDIAGQTFIAWRGVVHIVDAFLDCRRRTDKILPKYIERWDPAKNMKAYKHTHQVELDKMDRAQKTEALRKKETEIKKRISELKKERVERIQKLYLYNRVGGNEFIPPKLGPDDRLPSPPSIRVVRAIAGENNWVPFVELRAVDRFLTVTQLCKKVFQTLEEFHGHLRSLDKYLHLVYEEEEEHGMDMSYLQALNKVEEFMGQLAHTMNLELMPEDRKALADMSRLLTDELDLTEYLLYTLRILAHEIRHAVHVTYEFARYNYSKTLLRYEEISPPIPWTWWETLGCKVVYDDAENVKMDSRSAAAQFNTSPYLQLAQNFPVKELRHVLKLQSYSRPFTQPNPVQSAVTPTAKRSLSTGKGKSIPVVNIPAVREKSAMSVRSRKQ